MNRFAIAFCAMLAGLGLGIASQAGAQAISGGAPEAAGAKAPAAGLSDFDYYATLTNTDESAKDGEPAGLSGFDYFAKNDAEPAMGSEPDAPKSDELKTDELKAADLKAADDLSATEGLDEESDAPKWLWYAGIEATYLRPTLNDRSNPSPGALFARDFVSLDSFDAAPRLWLGLESCNGNGIRARYWQYNTDDTYFETIGVSPNVTTAADADLKAYTIDLEYTRRGQMKNWDVLGSIGLRQGSFSQGESASQFDTGSGAFASTSTDFRFSGTGLTASLEGRRPVGDCGFAFVANIRGSALLGKVKQGSTEVYSDGVLTAIQSLSDEEDNKTMWMLDTQIGVEWSHDLACCRGTVFARAMAEYQYWSVTATPYEMHQNNLAGDTVTEATNLSPNVSFYGPTFTVGFSR